MGCILNTKSRKDLKTNLVNFFSGDGKYRNLMIIHEHFYKIKSGRVNPELISHVQKITST